MANNEHTYDLVPNELKRLTRWVCWNGTEKRPTDPFGKLIRWKGRTEFYRFEEVAATRFPIGFFFINDDPYLGVDLDGCRDPNTKAIEPWADRIIGSLESYTEVSPSGTGVKIFCRGRSPFDSGRNTKLTFEDRFGKAPGIEIYDRGRYFTVTGDLLSEDLNDIRSVDSETIRALHDQLPNDAENRQLNTANDDRRYATHSVDGRISRARGYLAKIEPAVSGHNGHNKTFYVACTLVHGFDLTADQAWPLMVEFSERCRPPWSEHEIQHKLDDACKVEDKEGRMRGYLLGDGRESGPAVTQKEQHNLTDLGNAERLVEKFSDRIRFCHAWRRWLVFRNGCWRCDDRGRVTRLAGETVRAIPDEAFEFAKTTREAYTRHSFKSESAVRINAMVKLAQSLLPITPRDFESQPWLLNTPNCTIDLRTLECRTQNHEDYMLSMTGAKFDDSKQCPLWVSFLNRIFDGNDELIGYLQTLAGYWATGVVREHILPIFYGKGGNGKSVFLTTIQHVLGDYTMKCGKSFLMSTKHEQHPTAIADLFRRRLAIATETDEGRRLNEALVKELTGGDRVRARRMREDFWEFEPTHKIVLCTNHKPRISGMDDGIWRRIKLVPFTVQIPDREQDTTLTEKLKSESCGILNWIIDGCVKWQSAGLLPSNAIDSATNEYRAESDALGEFITERCVIRPDIKTQARSLFNAYKDWGGKLGEKDFGLQLTRRFEKRKSGGRQTYFKIGLREG